MSRIRLVFAEAWSSVTMNVSTTIAAIVTVLIGMFLLGLVIGFGTWTSSLSDHYKKQLVVNLYFRTALNGGQATKEQETGAARAALADPRVKKIQFVSRHEGLKQMQKEQPDLFVGGTLPANPLPDKIVVTPKRGEDVEELGRDLRRTGLPGVEDVVWGGKIAHRVLVVARVLFVVFLTAFVLLLVASTLLIANTIRLSLFARRREIEVMKLVGATNWFIRGPFMLEGFLCGVVGAVAAIVLLVIGKSVVLPSVIPHLYAGADVHALPFVLNAIALVGAGLVLGGAGSGLTLRRFLQV